MGENFKLTLIQDRLKPYFSHFLSPENLERESQPNEQEKEKISSIKEKIRIGLQQGFNPLEYKEKQVNKHKQEKESFDDLILIIGLFTQYQRQKQKEQSKNPDFFLHDEQILTLIRLAEVYKIHKGLICEMKVSEGKSQIVIPIFLSWLGLYEESIHIHEINPYLLKVALENFLDFANYLGIKDQVVGLNLEQLKETSGKRFIFGLWSDFIHWFQFSFLESSSQPFPQKPYLILDEIDQILMDEGSTPAIIASEIATDWYLEDFLLSLREDINQSKKEPFVFEYQGKKIKLSLEEFDEDLKKENFLKAVKMILSFEDIKTNIEALKKEGRSKEEIISLLLDNLGKIVLLGYISAKYELDFTGDSEFFQVFSKAFDEQDYYCWFMHPEIVTNLVLAAVMEEGVDYLIIENNGKKVIKPLSKTTGYQERGKQYFSLLNLFLYLKHDLNLPAKVQSDIDRISVFDFYLQHSMRTYGFTGTARTIAQRLYQGYGLETILIPKHYPDKRKPLQFFYFTNNKEKITFILNQLQEAGERRNTLIVVNSIEEAHILEKDLIKDGKLEVKILSAENEDEDQDLYSWISKKGEKRRILICAKMIGRGVDLNPDDQVKKDGFLLLAGSPMEYERSFNQLIGRIGRRGEEGEVRVFLSLDDPVFSKLGDNDRKKLIEYFSKKSKAEKEEKEKERERETKILKLIKKAWQRREDEVVDQIRKSRILFWPIVLLRNYIVNPDIKSQYIRPLIIKFLNLDKKKEDNLEIISIIEQKFRLFLRNNWSEILDYFEEGLKSIATAGSLGPFGQMSPESAVMKFTDKALKELFYKFLLHTFLNFR